MNRREGEAGYTLVEVMVAITLFSILSVGFYQVMFSGVRGADTTRNVSQISEEARLGFNRMIRDAREAGGHCFSAGDPSCGFVSASPTSYSIEIDFDGNGVVDAAKDEYLRYDYDAVGRTISVTSLNADGSIKEGPQTLIEGVEQVDPDGTGPGLPTAIFQFRSNRLEYDWNSVGGATVPDGITTWQEIDDPPSGVNGVGDRDGTLDDRGDDNPREIFYLSNIIYTFQVRAGDRVRDFYGEASLRNRRWATS